MTVCSWPLFWRNAKIPVVFIVIWVYEGARKTRQLVIFPLATTTVGWVLDRTPAGPKRSGGLGAKRRVVRAGCRLRMKAKGKPQPQTGIKGSSGLDAFCLRVYNH